MTALFAVDALTPDNARCHAIRVHIVVVAPTRIDKLRRDLQVLEVVGFCLHVFLEVRKELREGSFRQALDHVLLLVKVERHLTVAEFAQLRLSLILFIVHV